MHYKNGKEAKEGDPVICRGYDNQITVGKTHTITEGATCNCTVAETVMGGVTQLTCRTIGDMYHASDAFDAIEAITITAKVQAEAAANAAQVPAPAPAPSELS